MDDYLWSRAIKIKKSCPNSLKHLPEPSRRCVFQNVHFINVKNRRFVVYGHITLKTPGGGRVERRCWVNFQCRGVLLVWMIVGQRPIALAVGAGGGCLDIFFSHLSLLFSFSLSLGDGPI